jgi:hypothetical protein
LKQPDYEAIGVPELNVMTVNETFGLGYCLIIVAANQWFELYEVTVESNDVCPIFDHWLANGFNSPVRSFATSVERNGSSPAQSMQRNLRPPVLTTINRMGLRQVGQIGGGLFLGTGHLQIRREQ